MENYKYHPQNESELRQAIDAEMLHVRIEPGKVTFPDLGLHY